jgi:hypothetical protein
MLQNSKEVKTGWYNSGRIFQGRLWLKKVYYGDDKEIVNGKTDLLHTPRSFNKGNVLRKKPGNLETCTFLLPRCSSVAVLKLD